MDILNATSELATVGTAACVGVSWVWGRIKRRQGLREGIPHGIVIGKAEGLEEGLEQGLEQGLHQGIEKGIAEGSARVAFEVLQEFRSQGVAGVAAIAAHSPVDVMKAALQSATKTWATSLKHGQKFYEGEIYHITEFDKILAFDHRHLNLPGYSSVYLLIDGKSLRLDQGVPIRTESLPGHSLLLLSYDAPDCFDDLNTGPFANIVIRKDTETWRSASEGTENRGAENPEIARHPDR